MVLNLTKEQIAIGLLGGVVILTFFNFVRTITEKFLIKMIDTLPPKDISWFGLKFLFLFLGLLFLSIVILTIILANQTDLHFIFDIFRNKIIIWILIVIMGGLSTLILFQIIKRIITNQ